MTSFGISGSAAPTRSARPLAVANQVQFGAMGRAAPRQQGSRWGGSQSKGAAKSKRAEAARFRQKMDAKPLNIGHRGGDGNRRALAVQQAGMAISAAPPMQAPMQPTVSHAAAASMPAPAAAAAPSMASAPMSQPAPGPARKPKKCTRAKCWTPEVEQQFRFQQSGWRDAVEYEAANGPMKRWPNGFVKVTKVK